MASPDRAAQEDSRPLRPDHIRFVQEYLTNGNNGTQAVATIKPHLTRQSAAATASELLRTGRIRTEIQRTAKALGLTDKFLLGHLQSKLVETIETSQIRYDAKGEVIETVRWKRQPTPSEAAKVVDVINKSTGLYELNRAAGQALSSQFKELARKYKPKLSKRVSTEAPASLLVTQVNNSTDETLQICYYSPCGTPAIWQDATPS